MTNERFICEFREEIDSIIVKDTEQGWFFPVDSEIQAQTLKDKFNDLLTKSEPQSIDDYFREWDKAIIELNNKSIELINLKETYAEKEQEILTTVDFKEIYGANNEKVRRNHIKKELKPLEDSKNELETRISYLQRRIDFIKNLMAMQRTLLEIGEIE